MPAVIDILETDYVRATENVSLLRVRLGTHVDGLVLVVRGLGLPHRLLPLPTPGTGQDGRFAFAVPAALRDGRFSIAVDGEEVPLATPPERRREDAVAHLELQRARRRIAELEQSIVADRTETPAAADDDDGRAERLEQQLAQHRLLRARLARELEASKRREGELTDQLTQALSEREEVETELASLQEGSQNERLQLEEVLENARARVDYLERRLVEVRARTRPDDQAS